MNFYETEADIVKRGNLSTGASFQSCVNTHAPLRAFADCRPAAASYWRLLRDTAHTNGTYPRIVPHMNMLQAMCA